MNRPGIRRWRGTLLLPLLLCACSSLPFRVEGERPLGTDRGPQRKTVSAKEPPSRLVAVDGTVCLVSASRYDSVKVEERVWCDWRPRGGGAPE